MTDARAICPRCGEPVTVARQVRQQRGEPALCDRCYLDAFALIDAPERIEITYCTQCGAVKRGNRWVDVDADDRVDLAIDAVYNALGVHVNAEGITWSVTPEQLDETTVRVTCRVSGTVRETPVEESTEIPVKLSGGTCTRCGRIAGGSYGAIVQLRAKNRTPTEQEQKQARHLAHQIATEAGKDDRDAFLTEVTPVDAGVNMRVSTPKLGRRIATRIQADFGGTLAESETLVTEDEDGNEVYRVTYAVRLPEYQEGDIIDPEDDDGPVLVTGVHDRITGRRLATGAEYTATIDVDARHLGDIDMASETTLVMIEDDHAIQILDPETYEPTTVARPSDLAVTSETSTVMAVRTHAGLFVIPDQYV